MNINTYIDTVLQHINNKGFKREIEEELQDHILDRVDYYKEIGYDEYTSKQKAIEHMGNPEELGKKFNRLHNYEFNLAVGIPLLSAFIFGIIFYLFNWIDYTVVSTDSEAAYLYTAVASFITFTSSVICYRLSLKNRLSGLSIALGVVEIATLFISSSIFLPFGYSIFGFIFDYPAVFVNPDYLFFENEIGCGINNYITNETVMYILYYIELAFTSMFFFSGIINGIVSICTGASMIKGDFEDKQKHFNRFAKILTILTVICAVTLTIEALTYTIKTQAINNLIEQTAVSDFKESRKYFDKINLPMSKRKVNNIDKKITNDDIGLSVANDKSPVTVNRNFHYNVQVIDDDGDGMFETKRIYMIGDSDLTKKECEAIDKSMTSKELIKAIGLSRIDDYTYCVNGDKTEEVIILKVTTTSLPNHTVHFFYTFEFKNGKMTNKYMEKISTYDRVSEVLN